MFRILNGSDYIKKGVTMKKITLIAVLLIAVSTGSVFAESGWAIGLGYNFTLEGSSSVSMER